MRRRRSILGLFLAHPWCRPPRLNRTPIALRVFDRAVLQSVLRERSTFPDIFVVVASCDWRAAGCVRGPKERFGSIETLMFTAFLIVPGNNGRSNFGAGKAKTSGLGGGIEDEFMRTAQAVNQANDITAERRSCPRTTLNMVLGTIVFAEEAFILDCTICELSEAGARVMVPNPHFLPDRLVLLEPKKFVAHEASVRWRHGVLMGLSFDRSFSLDDQLSSRHRVLRRFALEAGTKCGF